MPGLIERYNGQHVISLTANLQLVRANARLATHIATAL